MPITQDRLLRLITAGEHFRDTAATLRHSVLAKCSAIFNHTLTIEQALSEITTELNLAVPADATHTAILSEERTRYNITHKRNSIEKRRIYNKRHSISLSSSHPRLSASETLASVNSRFPGATDDTDIDLDVSQGPSGPFDNPDVPTPADIHAAIDRALKSDST